jgi:ketosteroid isomerase-like protein
VSVDVQGFASGWVAAWNTRDLDRILALYSPDVVFTSPVARKLGHSPNGQLRGLAPFAAYVVEALQRAPELHFELITATRSVTGVGVLYRGHGGRTVVETMRLCLDGLIGEAEVFYGP